MGPDDEDIGDIHGFNPSVLADDRGRRVEKEMAPHSSTLAWKIPWTEGPVRL